MLYSYHSFGNQFQADAPYWSLPSSLWRLCSIQILIEWLCEVQKKRVGIEIDLVSTLSHKCCNVLGCLQASQINICWICSQRLTNLFCCFGLTLSLDNCCSFQFNGLLYDELCSLSWLLSNLFLLNGICEKLAKGQCSDGDIIEKNMVFAESHYNSLLDLHGYCLTTWKKGGCIILSNCGSKTFVDNRRKDDILIVDTECSIDFL